MHLPIDLVPLLSTFAIVSLAEFGDKTQIAVISLSAKHRPWSVFIGALLAFALIDGVSAFIGGAVAPFIPAFWIGLVAGISFLIFGVYTLFSKEDTMFKVKEHSRTVTTSFFLIAVMELGDKTQLAVIALSAEYGAPIQVFLGVMLAFILLTALGAIFGKIISRYISARYIKIGASLIFVVFGILFLFEAFTGMKLL
jgi:putative Ca2+/H+ antiporter (TMEM165/GDT1 family)